MNRNSEYDSEFCNVRYMENENIVFLTWKKFARLNDYKKPTLFALDLLKQYPHSNFVVDARNGFEDDKEDVEWGVSELLPNMSKTDCEYVIFIMPETVNIEDEMDMWTKEFGKYFAVVKVNSYEQAVSNIHNRILINVKYAIRPGKRDEFLEKLIENEIITASRAEPGNYKYEYYKPVNSENVLFLMEMWVSSEAQKAHGKTEHYQRLQSLKKEYVTDVTIEKYSVSAIL
jgi:quinol monooxygenase YgiN